jgi:hypothetical protein
VSTLLFHHRKVYRAIGRSCDPLHLGFAAFTESDWGEGEDAGRRGGGGARQTKPEDVGD